MKTIIRSLGVAMLAGLLAFLVVPSASADAGPARHGSDIAYTQYLNDDIITVCDREADGNGVYAEYYLNDGTPEEVGDANGSASGCGQDNWVSSPYWVSQFRVCETTAGCSGWVYPDGPGGGRLAKATR